jgi:hypothetical protein
MRRVPKEAWIFLIPATMLPLLLAVLLTIVYGYDPPKSAQPLFVFGLFATPFIDFGVICVTLILRLRGALRLTNPYVFTGLALACLHLLITALLILIFYLLATAMRGSLIFL